MVEVRCKVCEKIFETVPSRIKYGKAKYCGRICAKGTFFKKGIIPANKKPEVLRECVCGTFFRTSELRISQQRGKFCSKRCASNSYIGNIPWNKNLTLPQYSGKNHHNYKHGFTAVKSEQTKEMYFFYEKWQKMNRRCYSDNEPMYYRYGARGIKVLWQSFEQFRDDMYSSYLEHMKEYGHRDTTLDRTDNNGNYCKENCRWATIKEQRRNMSNNRIISYKGETKPFVYFTEKYDVSYKKALKRLNRGIPLEEIFDNTK